MTPRQPAAKSTARAANRPRKPATPPPETLEQVAARVAAAAPILGGLKYDLIEIARAAGAYRKTLMEQGFSQLETMAMVTEWHIAHWAIAQDEAADNTEPEEV